MKVSETFWLTVIGQAQNFSILIAVVLYLILPGSKRRGLIELGLLLIFSLLTEVVTWTGILVFHKNMNLAPNILRVFSLPFVILMYRNETNWKHRNIIAYILIAMFEIFALTNLFFIQGIHSINSYTSSVASFCIILMSMTYFFAHDSKSPVESAVQPPMDWINVAFLFYSCTTFFINLWVDYIVNVLQSNLISLWMVHNALGIAFYATLCYALVLIRRQHKNPQTPALTENLG